MLSGFVRGRSLTGVALLALVLSTTPALLHLDSLVASTGTTCVAHSDDIWLDPGIGLEPSSGTFQNTDTGTVECDGPINGRQPTGKGTWTVTGHVGVKDPDSCSEPGDGDFVHSFAIPTKDGEIRFGNAGTFTYSAFRSSGVLGGEFSGQNGHGTFTVQLKKGDCVTEPVTRLTADLTYYVRR